MYGRLSKPDDESDQFLYFFFSSRRRHTRYWRDWSSDVCSSDLGRRAALLVGDLDGEGGQRPAAADRCGDGGDDPLGGCPQVADVELHPDRLPARARAQRRGPGADRLHQRAGGAAVEQAERLLVALDRHGRDHVVGVEVGDADAELVVQRAHLLGGEPGGAVHGHPGTVASARAAAPLQVPPRAWERPGTAPLPGPTPSSRGEGRKGVLLGSAAMSAPVSAPASSPAVPSAGARPGPPRPRLLLLDGHSLAYRAFFALPVENFSTTTGQPTNAVYGFTSMLINVLRDEQPTHVAVAFDVGRKTFRNEIYAEYKANRSESPTDFRGQVSLIQEVLAALHVPVVTAEGYEADDVIATLTVQAVEQGMDVLICTGDRDALQLVNPHVTVLYPRKGVSDLTRFTPEEVETKYGLTPAQYPDFAALRGDPSDNLPSIPSVGEKTAAKWIREYGSLDALVDQVDTVKGKVGDKLREHLSSVLQNRRLTELDRAVPLELGPEQLAVQAWDRNEVHTLFDNLQFRVLRDRLFATLTSAEPEAEGGFDVTEDEVPAGGLGGWLAEHARTGRTGLIFRGTWGRGTGELTGLGLAAANDRATFVDLGLDLDTADEQALAAWLADPSAPKVAHEVKGPLLAIWSRGWELEGLVSDTALAAYLANPGQRSFDLGDLSVRYLKRELKDAAEPEGQLTLDGLGPSEDDVAREAAHADVLKAVAVNDLSDALESVLGQRGGDALLGGIELPLTRVLAAMEYRGIAADLDFLHDLQKEFADGVAAAAAECYDVIGRQVNLGSPKQLQAALFQELALPPTEQIKSGHTTDADALTSLLASTGHPFLEHLLRHRDVTRLRTVIDGLIPMVDDAGRIHTTDRKSTRLNSSHANISYAVFCLKKKIANT